METTGIDIKSYLFLLKRRWVMIVPIFLVVLAGGVAYCLFWPPIYEASCLVVVQPQKVPGDIIRPTVTTKIEERLQIITQQVLSRTRLTEIIERFDLYPDLRNKVTPDELAERMRKDITIKISRKNYFTITFLYTSPPTVAAVTNALAAFYVDSNLRLREQDAVGTARFLERELKRMRGQLSEWEKKISQFKREHIQELPESRELNIKLMDQQRQNANIMDGKVQRLRVRISGYEGQIARWQRWIEGLELQKAEQRRKGGTGGAADAQQMDSSPEGIKKRIEELRVFYTDDHPDIQRLLRHLKKAEAMEAEKKAKAAAEAAAAGLTAEQAEREKKDQELAKGKMSIRKLQERIEQINKEIRETELRKNKMLEQQEIIQKRIDNAPLVAEKLQELTRGYEELNSAYQKLHAKWLDARMSANMERTQRGEQFEVVDPAQVPDAPFRPQVKRAIPVTVGLALALSVGLAFGLNYIDVSYTSVNQLERQTGLPVLLVLPALETQEERAAHMRRNLIFGAIFGVLFLFLMGLVGILVTGRGPALKRMITGLLS
jgi:polysaccharide chain length determinant protein (PEP-CTERM system associated)